MTGRVTVEHEHNVAGARSNEVGGWATLTALCLHKYESEVCVRSLRARKPTCERSDDGEGAREDEQNIGYLMTLLMLSS